MPKPVIWSTQADKDLERILDYLAQEWENSVSAKFLDLVDFIETNSDQSQSISFDT